MTRDAQSLKISPWADTGERVDPENSVYPLDRDAGWPVEFSRLSGPNVNRETHNQLLREVTGMCVELNSGGSIPEWNAAVNYLHPAFVRHNGTLWISLIASGPATSVGESEPRSGSNVWREY